MCICMAIDFYGAQFTIVNAYCQAMYNLQLMLYTVMHNAFANVT